MVEADLQLTLVNLQATQPYISFILKIAVGRSDDSCLFGCLSVHVYAAQLLNRMANAHLLAELVSGGLSVCCVCVSSIFVFQRCKCISASKIYLQWSLQAYCKCVSVCLCRYLKHNRVLECPQCKNGITKMDGGCNHIM